MQYDESIFPQLEADDYSELKIIPSRGIVGIRRFMFTTGLCFGLDPTGYRGRWCYKTLGEAKQALKDWDGAGDPSGKWIKYKGYGGERSRVPYQVRKVDIDKLKPSLPFVYPWESQVVQYPKHGQQGISYFKGELGGDKWVDCLLYRNTDGAILGILNHYNCDFKGMEQRGNFNIWIHPDHQQQGIGTKLLTVALNTYEDITLEQQRWTKEGCEFIKKYISNLKDE